MTAIISSLVTAGLVFAFLFSTTIGDFIKNHSISQNEEIPTASKALLDEVEAYLDAFYMGDIDENKLYHYAAKGMAAATGDDYTKYYTPDEFRQYMETTTGEYVGVGIVLSENVDTNEIVVVLPYEGAPGEKAGVLPGDVILAVDGVVCTGDMLDETAERMRGKGIESAAGTTVTLTLKREGKAPFDVVLVREAVHLKTVDFKMLENDIGYMRIISFDSDTDVEVKDALQALSTSGMNKLVLDLRDNGGGDFNASINTAGKFLDENSLVVYTQNKNGERKNFFAEGKMSDCEIIVLINGNSASASEVLTGALLGNNRLKNIVGTKSFGKGITQNIYQLKNGGGMSITVDKYYTPTGECIHEKGIMPDTIVELDEDVISTMLAYEKDLQLQKAVELFKQ